MSTHAPTNAPVSAKKCNWKQAVWQKRNEGALLVLLRWILNHFLAEIPSTQQSLQPLAQADTVQCRIKLESGGVCCLQAANQCAFTARTGPDATS